MKLIEKLKAYEAEMIKAGLSLKAMSAPIDRQQVKEKWLGRTKERDFSNEYFQLYEWHNGSNSAFVFPEFKFLSLEEAQHILEWNSEKEIFEWGEYFIPIFEDGYYIYGIDFSYNKTNVIVYSVNDYEALYGAGYFDSVISMMETIEKQWQSKSYQIVDGEIKITEDSFTDILYAINKTRGTKIK